ncbi:MAG: acetyltransferase [Candidatus Binatia bacterium]|nr:MAG: acetyltransferase [Candidatus Binatia bacterium]
MTEGSDVRVRLIQAEHERALAAAIRLEVFVREQGIPLEAEFDPDDFSAVHALAFDRGCAVGTARLVLAADRARLGRLAVLEKHRHQKVGTALVRFLCDYGRSCGVRRIVAHAQVRALPFYLGLGFAVTSSIFDEDGIPHCRVEVEL